jgi:hypothetical protein
LYYYQSGRVLDAAAVSVGEPNEKYVTGILKGDK